MVKIIKKEFEVMKFKLLILFLGVVVMLSSCGVLQDVKSEKSEMCVLVYLLVMIDFYISVWLFMDNLYDGLVKYWIGKDFLFLGVVKVDGQIYCFMGMEEFELFLLVKILE